MFLKEQVIRFLLDEIDKSNSLIFENEFFIDIFVEFVDIEANEEVQKQQQINKELQDIINYCQKNAAILYDNKQHNTLIEQIKEQNEERIQQEEKSIINELEKQIKEEIESNENEDENFQEDLKKLSLEQPLTSKSKSEEIDEDNDLDDYIKQLEEKA